MRSREAAAAAVLTLTRVGQPLASSCCRPLLSHHQQRCLNASTFSSSSASAYPQITNPLLFSVALAVSSPLCQPDLAPTSSAASDSLRGLGSRGFRESLHVGGRNTRHRSSQTQLVSLTSLWVGCCAAAAASASHTVHSAAHPFVPPALLHAGTDTAVHRSSLRYSPALCSRGAAELLLLHHQSPKAPLSFSFIAPFAAEASRDPPVMARCCMSDVNPVASAGTSMRAVKTPSVKSYVPGCNPSRKASAMSAAAASGGATLAVSRTRFDHMKRAYSSTGSAAAVRGQRSCISTSQCSDANRGSSNSSNKRSPFHGGTPQQHGGSFMRGAASFHLFNAGGAGGSLGITSSDTEAFLRNLREASSWTTSSSASSSAFPLEPPQQNMLPPPQQPSGLLREAHTDAASPQHAEDERKVAVPTLRLVSGACILPHPDKVERGGEDAFFISNSAAAVGVADGVGGWADVGVDAGAYARELMRETVRAVEGEYKGQADPLRVLETAHARTKSQGSSTACLVLLSADQRLAAANVGDSGFVVIRNGHAVFRSPPQQHDFNFPYQLGSVGGDAPSSAEVYSLPVVAGDVIVLGTDGLFDNVFETEVTNVVMHSLLARRSPQATAEHLAALARIRASDRLRLSPFARAAMEAGYRYYGGKMDDITVVVSYVSSANGSSLNGKPGKVSSDKTSSSSSPRASEGSNGKAVDSGNSNSGSGSSSSSSSSSNDGSNNIRRAGVEVNDNDRS